MTRSEIRRDVLIQCALIVSAALLVMALVPVAQADELTDRGRAACQNLVQIDPERTPLEGDALDACADELATSLAAAGCEDVVSVLACIAEVETLADSAECDVLCSGTTGGGDGAFDPIANDAPPTPTPADANAVAEENRLIDQACQHAAAVRTEGMDIDAPADSNPSVASCVEALEQGCDDAAAAASCVLEADTAAAIDDCMTTCE